MTKQKGLEHLVMPGDRFWRVSLAVLISIATSNCHGNPAAPVRALQYDDRYLHAINQATQTNPDDLINEIRNSEHRPALTKDQFETTSEYQARVAAEKPLPAYGAGYVTFVQPLDFSYDADDQTMSFSVPRSNRRSSSDGYLTVCDGPTLRLLPVGAGPPPELTVALPRAEAERYRNAKFEIAIVTTLNGLTPPVLSGPVDWDDLFKVPPSNGDLNEFEAAENKHARQWLDAQFGLKVHVVRVMIFDRSIGGVERPIYQWPSGIPQSRDPTGTH